MADADELLRRCRHGDGTALAELVRLFEGPIFRLACRVTGDPARAEEATVDALARVWEKAGQWREESSAGTWIYRVALRVILDSRRSWPRWPAVTAEVADRQPGPAEAAVEADAREQAVRRIEAGLARLSPPDRALVHLFYFEERTLAEIGEILESNRDAVKTRLARARDRLRKLMQDCDELP